jgi:hypothetical protein
MRNSLAQALKIFFSPETILPFLLGSVFLAVLGNAVYDILKNLIGATTPELLRIAFGAFLVFMASVCLVAWLVSRKLSRLTNANAILSKRKPEQHRGLILLVSREEPCHKAMRYHLPRLKRCWLICSTQTLEIAEKLRQEFPRVCLDEPIVINDIYDPLEFRDQIDDIYANLPMGWLDREVITDYVGMTAHGSVGVVLACSGTDRPLQYTPALFDSKTKQPLSSVDPIEIVLEPDPRQGNGHRSTLSLQPRTRKDKR